MVKDVWTSVTEGLKADLDSRRTTDPGGSAPDPGDSAPDQSHKCADEVSFMPPNVDAMSEATIRKYQDQAHVMIDQSVTLLVETSDWKAMVEMLRAAINRHESPVAAGTSMYDMGHLCCEAGRRVGDTPAPAGLWLPFGALYETVTRMCACPASNGE